MVPTLLRGRVEELDVKQLGWAGGDLRDGPSGVLVGPENEAAAPVRPEDVILRPHAHVVGHQRLSATGDTQVESVW